MKWLLLGLLVLVASVAVALVALPDPGYILIGYGKYSIETSLLVFLVMLGIGYLALRLLAGFWRVPGSVRQWGQRRQVRRLHSLFDQAVIELSEGRLERGESRLAYLLRSKDAPLEAYLSAARAASQLGADDRRDRYLKLCQQRNPTAEAAVALTEAELQLSKSQLDQAQTTITRLQKLAPHNSQTLRLMMQLYLQQQDWQRLRDLLPELRGSQVLNQDQWQRLAAQVYREQVAGFAQVSDVDALNAGWKQLPPPVQKDEGLLAVYTEQLVRLGENKQAERLLGKQLKHGWNQRLVYLFGDLQSADAAAQQALAEQWLEQHPQDPVLLLTLGKISLRNQLWGKARSYLEASINQQATPEAYRLLGNLLEQLEETEEAAACYRKGIALTGGGVPEKGLPALGSEWPSEEKVKPVSRSA